MRLKRESLPGGNTFPRALGISTLQPVSRSKSPGLRRGAFLIASTGRGGMFLAPAGNPSSLRVGHPDVATEHTCLSPCFPPLPVVRGRVRLRGRGANRGLLGLGRLCGNAEGEYSG